MTGSERRLRTLRLIICAEMYSEHDLVAGRDRNEARAVERVKARAAALGISFEKKFFHKSYSDPEDFFDCCESSAPPPSRFVAQR